MRKAHFNRDNYVRNASRWPFAVQGVYLKAVDRCLVADIDPYETLHGGPGHVVWGDENFENCHVLFCLNLRGDERWLERCRLTKEQLDIAFDSLEDLRPFDLDALFPPED